MTSPLDSRIETDLDQFRRDGVYKHLNYIESPQGPRVRMEGRGEVIVLSSNNYLGLSDEPEVVAAGQGGTRSLWGRYRLGSLHLRDLHGASRAGGRLRPPGRYGGLAQFRELLERQ